jgi:outer membrane protein assembly factor BamB
VICLALAALLQVESWPGWRGPRRDDVSVERSGFDGGAWPPGEPAWRRNVGAGSTSPIVADGRVYVMGWSNGRDTLACLDAATGETRWEVSYAAPEYPRFGVGDQGLYNGVTSTPEMDPAAGLIFTLGTDGQLQCWDARREGARVWGINLYDAYRVPRRPKPGRGELRDYGYTSSPLVRGDTLVVEVGSPDGLLMGFEAKTGRRRWTSQAKGPAGHNGGPAPINVEGVPCVAVQAFEGLVVARLDPGHEGRTVATFPWVTDFANNIASVAVHGDSLLLTSGYNQERTCRLRIRLDGAQVVWEQRVYSKVCTPVIHKGRVFWAWEKLRCLDWETGRPLWEGGAFGDPGSCIMTADDRLIVLGGKGDLALVDAAGATYAELARREGLFQTYAWPHVVLSEGRLYCKDRNGNLVCFGLPRK